MRLLKIGIYYPAYLAQFYSMRPDLASQSFAIQHAELMNDRFGSSDFWTTALNKVGYETCDVVANAEPLQKTWAEEHGLPFDESDWLFEITAAQVATFRPEVLIVADYSTVTAEFLAHLRDVCPSIRLVLGWCGAPYRDGSIFHECDLVLSCVPELVAQLEKEGHVSHHVNHAFDPRVLEQINVITQPTTNFSFIGSIVKSDHFHISREKILSHLIRETGLQIWTDAGCQPSPDGQENSPLAGDEANMGAGSLKRQTRQVQLFAGLRVRAAQFVFGKPGPPAFSQTIDQEIKKQAKAPLFGVKMFQQLHDSRVTLNTHIDISHTNASNMRLFEATGVGACLLTDWKANLSTLFEPDSEVIAYRDPDDCVEKVRYLLMHNDERRAIAAAGQRRTLRDHTFDHRTIEVDTIIRNALTGAATAARPGK